MSIWEVNIMKNNQDIRELVAKNGFKLWELADALGVNDGNLSRRLRHELPEDQKNHIFFTIEKMIERRNTDDAISKNS